MKRLNFVLCLVCTLLISSAAQAVTIDMVTVGNPGNAADTRYNGISVGSVANAYQIGKYEVTAGQYTEFLNAVAEADPNGLYNTSMTGSFGANIQRTGSSPTYSYSVAADWANRPVNFVSFWDAARFANWLDNGQPTGAQGPGTTEDGAYHDVGNQTLFGRNAGAKFFIPSEDEWYKAAYHDQSAGLAASYFDFPTGTNAVPGREMTEATNPGNNANYYLSGLLIGSPYYRTVAGEFELSDSPYGTFDQGGNVWEWNETVLFGSYRNLRGGSFNVSPSGTLHASLRGSNVPTGESSVHGFRVASTAVPEPSTLLLLCFGSLAVLWRRRGLVCASILAAAVGISFADRAEADTFASGANTFDIEFVTIGNPGNAADTDVVTCCGSSFGTTIGTTGYGSVPYSYRIGKFEVSRDMVTKSNSAGGLGITLADMTGIFGGNGVNRPATGVVWNEAARFVNWLNTSNGNPPAYKFAFQPGEVGYNPNSNIELWTISDAGYNPDNLYRNSLARYFLPSADEWYKAAYYDPSANDGTGGYWNYPTGSDSAPTPVASGTAAGTAVYRQTAGPTDIPLAGGLSPYGTMGQGGNVDEWDETDVDLVNDSSSSYRGGRGCYWGCFDENFMSPSYRGSIHPASGGLSLGFRVASIPEPSTLLLGALAGFGLLWRRRRAICLKHGHYPQAAPSSKIEAIGANTQLRALSGGN